MAKEFRMLINGKWCRAASGKTFKSINPANEGIIGLFQEGNEADARKAVQAAKKAFPLWAGVPAPKRGEILFGIANELNERKDEFAELISLETGKPLTESKGEAQEAIDIAYYLAGEGRRLFGYTTKSELKDKAAFTVRLPVGVCSLITPWNFPISIPAIKMLTALVCGNSFVLKPSSNTPLCATKLVELIEKHVKMPGIVNLVTGPGGTAGKELIVNEDVRLVAFTGSRETGEFIRKNSGLKKIGLELGGKNAIIVMDDAEIDLAVDGVVWGAFGTTGQRCTACSRVIVHEKIKKEFLERLLKRVKKLRIGSGLKEGIQVGPLINRQALEKTGKYVKLGLKEGARLCCGGKKIKGKGFFFEPTVFIDVKPGMRIAREEIFGPVLSIISVKGLDEAISAANEVEYGLSSAIYTASIANAFKAIEGIEAGLTYINSSTIGSEAHLPFGGVKATGSTREMGINGIDEFTEIKTVYIDYSGKLQKAQID